MKFTQLILESNSNILYHRSEHEFKDGEILNAIVSSKYDNDYERHLESYRLNYFPSKPSRKQCFYMSPTTKSRFHYRGLLYQVKPIGITHTTNCNIIDSLGNANYDGKSELESKLIEEYWEPGNKWVNKSQIRNIEVLCNRIQVISRVDNKNELFSGDKIKCIKEFEYFLDKDEILKFSNVLRKKLVDKEIISYLSKEKILTIKKNTIWEITEISKSKDFIFNKKDGNIWGIDLINNNFKIELVYGYDDRPNLNKFLKEHFIKL
jgi:hypothetical protein